MTPPTPQPGSPDAWLLASRPATLAAAFVPVAVGAACAWASGGLRWGPTLAALAVALLIQVGTNFANDVFDFEKGADTGERLGPTRAVQAGLLDAAQIRRGMWIVFGLAFVAGLYLAAVAGWEMIVVGVVSILCGIAYTGGPFPLGYNGLGDVFVFLFFGFVAVTVTAYVSLLTVPGLALWASVPVGALSTNILVVNNIRDRHGDREAGKRTLAVLLGRRGAMGEYVLLTLLAYAVPAFLALRADQQPWLLLPLLTLPWAVLLIAQLARREGRPLNATLVGTARLLVVHGLLFAFGLVLAEPIPIP